MDSRRLKEGTWWPRKCWFLNQQKVDCVSGLFGLELKKKSMSLGLVCCILKKKNPCHSLQVEDKNLGVKGGPSIFNPDQSHELLIPLFSRML